MRIHFGEVPPRASSASDPLGWALVTGPSAAASRVLPWILGLAMLFALITPAVIRSFLAGIPADSENGATLAFPWTAVVVVIFLFVPAHELLHAAFLPDFGLSDATTFVIWPRGLRFGVFYEGSLSRARWLFMRSAPFLFLAVLPALGLVVLPGDPSTFTLETCLSLSVLLNSVGSGGDLVAVLWVASRLPTGSRLLFHGGRAYWRDADGHAAG